MLLQTLSCQPHVTVRGVKAESLGMLSGGIAQHELTNTSVRVPEKHSVRVLISEFFRGFKTRTEHMPSLYPTNDISKSRELSPHRFISFAYYISA